MDTIMDKVRDLVATSASIPKVELKPESKFVDDLGMDSLDQIEATMAIEEAFGIEIPDQEVEELLTIKDMVEYIKKKKGGD